MIKSTMLFLGSLALVSSVAFADQPQPQPESFIVGVARAQIDLNCKISADNGGSTDCTVGFSSRGRQEIVMTQGEAGGGFAGVDMVSDSSGQFMLIATTDDAKALNSVNLVHLAQGASQTSFNANISTIGTNQLAVMSIPRLAIEVGSDQAVTIAMSLVAYAPATSINMVTASSFDSLIDHALLSVQPAVKAARLLAK